MTSLCVAGIQVIITPEKVLAIGSHKAEIVLIADIPDNYIEEYRKNSLCWQRLSNAKQKVFAEISQDYIVIIGVA